MLWCRILVLVCLVVAVGFTLCSIFLPQFSRKTGEVSVQYRYWYMNEHITSFGFPLDTRVMSWEHDCRLVKERYIAAIVFSTMGAVIGVVLTHLATGQLFALLGRTWKVTICGLSGAACVCCILCMAVMANSYVTTTCSESLKEKGFKVDSGFGFLCAAVVLFMASAVAEVFT